MTLKQAIQDNIEHMTINGEENVPYVRLQYISEELEETKETRIYIIEVDNKFSEDYTNEEFMTLAEEQGTVYSLTGFQDAFNEDTAPSETSFMRIITQ